MNEKNARTRHRKFDHRVIFIFRGVVAKMLDFGLEVNKFEFQSHYNVRFQTNTLGKDMNLIFPQ